MAEFEQFKRPREATVRFSDVFGLSPINGLSGRQPLHDFDALLTDQVRNTGCFADAQYGIGSWPETGDYAAVLLEQLRSEQINRARSLGIAVPASAGEAAQIHPDDQVLAESLGKAVVGIVNHAPRSREHHTDCSNGDEFYVGLTASGVEIYAQRQYFRGLRARDLLRELYLIPNDNPIWSAGEQFRSSHVSQARRDPQDVLAEADLDCIPVIELAARAAYADKFGNVRLEIAEARDMKEVLVPGGAVHLKVGGHDLSERVRVYNRLTDIPEDQLGIYYNPTEEPVESGPAYWELSRRVSDPNTTQNHAYATLWKLTSTNNGLSSPSDWEKTNIQILPDD